MGDVTLANYRKRKANDALCEAQRNFEQHSFKQK